MGETAAWDLPYPELSDAPNVPLHVQALADEVDSVLTTLDNASDALDTRIDALEAPLLARATSGASVTGLNRNADHKVDIDTSTFENFTCLNAVNNRMVMAKVGYWQITYTVDMSNFVNVGQPAYASAWVSRNGGSARARSTHPVSAANQVVTACGLEILQVTAITDYVELYTRYTSATAGATYDQAFASTILPCLALRYLGA